MSEIRDDKYGAHPKTEDELIEYVRARVEGGESGYSESAEALHKVAVAAFNYAAYILGVTGFQASWAELQFLKTTRGLDGPFGILNGEHLVYPQYDLAGQAREWIEEWTETYAREKAAELLAEDKPHVADRVREHWRKLAEGVRS